MAGGSGSSAFCVASKACWGGLVVGQCLMAALGVVHVVEGVDLGLEFLDGLGVGLGVEVLDEGLVETFDLALGGGVSGLAGDARDPQGAGVDDKLADEASPGGVQRGAVVGEQLLRDAVALDGDGDDLDGVAVVLRFGDQGGQGEAGVVVDELEDGDLAAPSEVVFHGVELPARVGGGVLEALVGGMRLLLRLVARDARAAEDPGQARL